MKYQIPGPMFDILLVTTTPTGLVIKVKFVAFLFHHLPPPPSLPDMVFSLQGHLKWTCIINQSYCIIVVVDKTLKSVQGVEPYRGL